MLRGMILTSSHSISVVNDSRIDILFVPRSWCQLKREMVSPRVSSAYLSIWRVPTQFKRKEFLREDPVFLFCHSSGFWQARTPAPPFWNWSSCHVYLSRARNCTHTDSLLGKSSLCSFTRKLLFLRWVFREKDIYTWICTWIYPKNDDSMDFDLTFLQDDAS